MSSMSIRVPKNQVRKSSDILRNEKADIITYIREMFQNSMLTGVPQIVAARTTRSKFFKTFVFLGSLIGFIYQTSSFLAIYFNYPTLVDVQVTTPPFVDIPAITVCNRNGLKRSLFCKMKPEKCAPLKKIEQMCEDHPEMCLGGNLFAHTLYPKIEAYEEEISATQEVLQQIGHTDSPLISQCYFRGMNETRDICRRETYRSFIFQDTYDTMKMCHIMNARWSYAKLNLPQAPVRATLHLVLDMEPEEYFRMDRKVGAQVAIHSPWNILNPFTEGFQVQPKKVYLMHIQETIKNLLPYPYQTNCTDYIEQWRRRGQNGPLSKEMCIEECVLNQTMDKCNCVLPSNMYPHNFNFCSGNTDFCTNAVNYTHCFVKCSPACHSRSFEVEMKEDDVEVVMTDQITTEALKWNRTALIKVIFKRTQVNLYRYRAKYESIELYSFLGGFIGIWLGISLIAVMDFVESVGSLVLFVIGRLKESQRLAHLSHVVGRSSKPNSRRPSEDSLTWAQPFNTSQ